MTIPNYPASTPYPISRFISDLHLSQRTPQQQQLFFRLLRQQKTGDALYILGDFFDLWLGDEDWGRHQDIIQALSDACRCGVKLFMLHGNHDFLLSAETVQRIGGQLLADTSMINVGNLNLILTHGDLLCTDDVAYQQFRRMTRDKTWQQSFLQSPLAQRQQAAAAIMQESSDDKSQKSMVEMDVTASAVEDVFRQYQPAINKPLKLIHGHTHLPACHQLQVEGEKVERWVLASWLEASTELMPFQCLKCDGNTLETEVLSN